MKRQTAIGIIAIVPTWILLDYLGFQYWFGGAASPLTGTFWLRFLCFMIIYGITILVVSFSFKLIRAALLDEKQPGPSEK